MKRHNGFTLIEMIIVIVILGVLSIAAAPRFFDIISQARIATLQGIKGSMQGAADIANAKSLIENITDGFLSNGVKIVHGYPTADPDGIILAVDVDGDLFKLMIKPSDADIAWGFSPTATTCYVGYSAPSAPGETATTIVNTDC
ncbi:type II secretion system protein [Photobacterium leiognathi]|uniref:type II secretion system protein n=1 Tax=Photobacterium leiognathi TaxID=553611 RepID=UPI00273A4DDC|nr:type II secretion system protein [Photobacterium leiognathi]